MKFTNQPFLNESDLKQEDFLIGFQKLHNEPNYSVEQLI